MHCLWFLYQGRVIRLVSFNATPNWVTECGGASWPEGLWVTSLLCSRAATPAIVTKSLAQGLSFLVYKMEAVIPAPERCCEDRMKESILRNSLCNTMNIQ